MVVECDKVSLEPPLLQTKESQFPQLLFIRLLLQTPHQLHCPSLDTLQGLNVFLVVKGLSYVYICGFRYSKPFPE